jgi:hemoglobin-like flavoprotein
MTPQQVRLVQSSWQQVVPIQETAAGLFYSRLFEVDPAVTPLCKGNMVEQGRRLMTMIGSAVAGLGRLDQLAPLLRNLGRRHADYGVTDAHYETVGGALLWTLERGLGAAFSNEVKEAWLAAYQLMSSAMKEGAAQAQEHGGGGMRLPVHAQV